MTEEIVSKETAKLLCTKGFNLLVYYSYAETVVKDLLVLCEPDFHVPENHNSKGWRFKKFSAPTQSLAQKWLREVHNIQANTFPLSDGKWEYILFFLDQPIEDSDGYKNKMCFDRFNSYEEALEAALQDALKLI